MNDTVLLSGAVAALFALVHIAGKWMRFLQVTPRSIWLSFAGGVSLAYVFVHLLPELAERQERSLRHIGEQGAGGVLELHAYLAALAGLATFYGLDRMVRLSKSGGDDPAPIGIFWIHLGSYAVYNALVGYLLVHREGGDAGGLLVYALALGLHFAVNDQGLRDHHGRTYDRAGRWLLAAAPVAGWAAGLALSLSAVAVGLIFAFLAGGIILNVLKEELPEDRESRFWALALGAVVFSALLLAAR